MTTCTTCGKPAHSPFRVYNSQGKVIMGCIDGCHTGQLAVPSESNYWHNRPVAKKWRANVKKFGFARSKG